MKYLLFTIIAFQFITITNAQESYFVISHVPATAANSIIHNKDIIYESNNVTIKTRIKEIDYSQNFYITGYTNSTKIVSPDKYIKEIGLTILNKNGDVLCEESISNFKPGISHTLRLNHIMVQAGKKSKLSEMIEGSIIIQLKSFKKTYYPFTLFIDHYRVHFLADLKLVEDGTNELGQIFNTLLSQSLLKSQINIAYLKSKDIDTSNVPIVLSTPILRFNSRSFFLDNFELGICAPVSSNDNSLLVGWGLNIGFFKYESRTALQFGGGVLTKDISNQNTKDDFFWYLGLDLVTFGNWISNKL